MRETDDRERPGEPLHIALWLGSAQRLYRDLLRADAHVTPDRLLRRTFVLSQLLPDPLWRSFSGQMSEVELEVHLSRNELEHAARGIMSVELVCDLHGRGHAITARVELLQPPTAGSFEAPDAPRALLGAWLSCVLQFVHHGATAGEISFRSDQHISQSEQHQSSTLH